MFFLCAIFFCTPIHPEFTHCDLLSFVLDCAKNSKQKVQQIGSRDLQQQKPCEEMQKKLHSIVWVWHLSSQTTSGAHLSKLDLYCTCSWSWKAKRDESIYIGICILGPWQNGSFVSSFSPLSDLLFARDKRFQQFPVLQNRSAPPGLEQRLAGRSLLIEIRDHRLTAHNMVVLVVATE